MASVAPASLITYDGFDYATGNLRGTTLWPATGSNGSTPRPQVVSGSLSFPGLGTTGNSVQLTNANGFSDRTMIGTQTTGSFYYSMMVSLGSSGGNTGVGEIAVYARCMLYAVFVLWGLYFVSLDLTTNEIGDSFMRKRM